MNADQDGKLYRTHIAVLSVGFFAGVIAAFFFNRIDFGFSSDVLEARRLGIVSRTILDGYSKKKDLLAYLSVFGFPVLFSIAGWLLWARGGRRSRLKELFSSGRPDMQPKRPSGTLYYFLTLLFFSVVSFDLTGLYVPNYNDVVGAWPFLAEEGEMLAWAHSILSGGVYGRDFYCTYGPMLVYPLAWTMKIFGEKAVVGRFFTYFLNMSAYAALFYFLHKTLHRRIVFFFAAFIVFLVFSPYTMLSPNTTYLRVALGVLPILIARLYLSDRKWYLPPLIGLIAGQSLLFSQEVGVCSIVAVAVLFALDLFFGRSSGSSIKTAAAAASAGLVLSVAPMISYLYFRGALKPFVSSILGYPKLAMLGFASLPFPSFESFILNPFSSEGLLPYWIIFVYAFSLIYVFPSFFLRKPDRGRMLFLSLIVFGGLLYRSAVARSDEEHILYSAQPAFLLAFMLLDMLADDFSAGTHEYAKTARRAGAFALTAFILVPVFFTGVSSSLAFSLTGGLDIKRKISVVESGTTVPGLDRAGLFFDTSTAESIRKIKGFLDAETSRGDYVYFFPNEAAYYFLFDRKNPTRYALSYFAITKSMKLELAASLEEKKPEYVIYSRNTWRLDNIGEDVLSPEIMRYLKLRYEPFRDLGDVVIAKRKR